MGGIVAGQPARCRAGTDDARRRRVGYARLVDACRHLDGLDSASALIDLTIRVRVDKGDAMDAGGANVCRYDGRTTTVRSRNRGGRTTLV